MRSYLNSVWRAALLLCLGLLKHFGEAQVFTEAPVGPLYRVVGSPLFISCNVSGFVNKNSQKQFEFRIRKPAKPDFDINIISTADKAFTYTMYAERVRSNQITLEYVSLTSVLLKIKTLEKGDEGDYECNVINEERAYRGTYNAVTTVKVLDDSLSVSSSDPPTMTFVEGDGLTLTCQASSNTIQHTHLSFAWYLRAPATDHAEAVISLDKDFTLSAGQDFDERYKAGLVRLDKISEASYRLNVAELQLSDSGRIYCQAQEWIQDPDRSWYCITHKDSEEIVLNVNAREMDSGAPALVVRILAHLPVLHEGQELSLSCTIDTANVEKRFFSVAWLRGGNVTLAHIGPTGILSVGPEYSGREKQGELRAARTGSRQYSLILQPVRTDDHGAYICRAWPQERGQDGAFTRGAAQDSSPQLISISATESGISVEMQGSFTVNEGNTLNLTCKVSGVKGQLSVTWQYKTSTSTARFINVVSLSQEGVKDTGGEFKSRSIRAERPATDTFTLELDEVTAADSGVYQCAVSEWKTNSKTNSQSHTAAVTVTPIDLFVKVSLRSRKTRVTTGQNVDLMCLVKGPRMPVTVTWSLRRDGSTTPDNIVTLYSDGSISWSGSQQRYQLKVENQKSQLIHYLLINGAGYREAGRYQCSVSVFLDNAHKKLPLSNLLALIVEKPASDLRLVGNEQQLTVMEGDDVELKCDIISSMSSPPYFFKVVWLYTSHSSSVRNVSLVELDHKGLLSYPENQALGGLQGRLHLSRNTQESLRLGIQRAHEGDSGTYQCLVEQYQWDHEGVWQEEASESAGPVMLTVNVTENNLFVETDELELNVSSDFTVPCNIRRQSSNDSEFQVTWFWQKATETKQNPIFTSYRNSTLHNRSGKDFHVRFHHPVSNQFNLTILMPGPENSGLYYCEVEEWLPSLSHGWRKAAVEKSKYLTINVQRDGNASHGQSGIWIGILAAISVCSLLVILVLVLKMCNMSGEKKTAKSLWAEEVPFETKLGAEY